jgi:hypothetical protein
LPRRPARKLKGNVETQSISQQAVAVNRFSPRISFHGPRSSRYYVQDGNAWRPMSASEGAKRCTGFDPTTHELHIGVFIRNYPNEYAVVGFDLFKTDLMLRAEALARLESRWREEAVSLSKRLRDKAHFSTSFVEVPTTRDRVEHWRSEVEAVLGDPESYEHI